MELPVVLFFGLSVGIKVYSYVYRKTTRSKVASKCAEISELVIFPVKSMRGVKVNHPYFWCIRPTPAKFFLWIKVLDFADWT